MGTTSDIASFRLQRELDQIAENNDINYINLNYKVDQASLKSKSNKISFDVIQKLSEDVGIILSLTGDILSISVDTEKYATVTNKTAGRNRTIAHKEGTFSAYYYSDIVYMKSQGLLDKDIAKKIDMPIATFKRHKKDMIESTYYTNLDKTKLNDIEYLKSFSTNYMF